MIKFKLNIFSIAILTLGAIGTVNAALIGRLALTEGGTDYQAYYDDEANLTWLADANAAKGTSYDVKGDGRITWNNATDWTTNLTVNRIGGWRLPDTLPVDPGCSFQYSQYGSQDYGANCSGSEMGNMYYNVLGNTAGRISNTGPFSNLIQDVAPSWWSITDNGSSYTGLAWMFGMTNGDQLNGIYKTSRLYVWAVQTGDVVYADPIPVPAALWLFSSGLIGLFGFSWFRR